LEDKVVDPRDAGDPQLGFLLSEQDGRFKVLLLSLTTRSFPKSDVRVERVELADIAREVVAGKAGDSVADLESTDIFVLARDCKIYTALSIPKLPKREPKYGGHDVPGSYSPLPA
jgi:hypothetical protein